MAAHVLCVSWNPALASTREWLLNRAGFRVTSALGKEQAKEKCSLPADLLVLGHSVPREEKRAVIGCFREYSTAPVLSLVIPGETKLPEADYAVESYSPGDFVQKVEQILQDNRNSD